MLLLLFIYSCGYPDIDSVPTFNKVDLTDEELQELLDPFQMTEPGITGAPSGG